MAKDDLTVHLEAEDFAADSLQVHILQGRERISELFSFEVEVVCSEPGGLDIEEIGGASVAIVFERSSGETRRIHGMVAEVCDLLNTEDEYGVYRLQIVPRAWRLNMVETLDVYLDMSIPEIIERKLSLVGLTDDGIDYEKRLLESYPTREFVVQYRETDLQFVGRLAEHLGISYVFEHSKQCDTIVFLDEKGGFRPDVGGVQYRGRGERIDLFELQRRQRLVPSTYVARDYNYRTPSLEIEAQHALERSYAGGVVEYGAHIKTPEQAKMFARVRAEERLATQLVYEGRSAIEHFSPGAYFEVQAHPTVNPELRIVEVEHRLSQPVALRGRDTEEHYNNRFLAIEADLQYRPPRVTPVPRIYGIITGVIEPDIEGDVGKYAKIDEQGRYTVKFLFDTVAPGERKASRPVRRMQPSAGPNYGMHFPLRPGVEVAVTFVDGDPDRPLIVGAVPNPLTPTPVDQSTASKNRIKTESGVLFEIEDGSGS